MPQKRELTFVWSRSIRLFHWLNVLTITALIVIGLVIFNSKALGVSVDGKILLKTIHVIIGYIFAINLIFRITLGFIGSSFERWSQMLPFLTGYLSEFKQYRTEKGKVFKGHNPLGKLMVLALMTLMSIQMATGLVLAGTDIYYPPLGKHFATSVAKDESKLDEIKPYSKTNIDEAKYQEMRAFRSPIITAHVYAFYGLLILIPLHIFGVVFAERKEKSGLVSSMVSGYKYLPSKGSSSHH